MPYSSISQLPDKVRNNMSEKEQSVFMKAFNRAYERGEEEQVCFKIAYGAVKNMENYKR
jgi:cation transport regulator ChaB